MRQDLRHDRRGVALVLAIMVAMVVAAVGIGAVVTSGNSLLTAKFYADATMMEAAADGGLERGRDRLNGEPRTYLSGVAYRTLEANAAVRDADGNVIPGFTRSTYAGLTGNRTGQYGVFASVVSVVSTPRGAVVVRRAELSQESFAKFARFDNRTTSSVVFASGIQVFGPLHTNQTLYVGSGSPRPVFHGPVTTAATISGVSNGDFRQGYRQNVATIPMPTTTELATLRSYALSGNMVVTGDSRTATSVVDPDTRVEFVAVDLNGDNQFNGTDEGFLRVYKASAPLTTAKRAYVTARRWATLPTGTSPYPASMPAPPSSVTTSTDPNLISPNCGGTHGGDWWTADSIYSRLSGTNAQKRDAVRTALLSGTRRCYLGGDRRLYPDSLFRAADGYGGWVQWAGWGGTPAAALVGRRTSDGLILDNTSALYLWPINRAFNTNFKGVVYVDGAVAVSGLVRGQVTLAASGNVLQADDLTYVTTPGSSSDCSADIFGVLTPGFYYLEDNSVQAPFSVPNAGSTSSSEVYRTGFDDSPDLYLHGAVLTLNSIATENLSGGNSSTAVQACLGTLLGGRGCFFMTGSAIQEINAARMTSSGTGWNPQWSYDRCMGIRPPPYYPTTGRYYSNRYYELDPAGFDVAAWFDANQPGY